MKILPWVLCVFWLGAALFFSFGWYKANAELEPLRALLSEEQEWGEHTQARDQFSVLLLQKEWIGKSRVELMDVVSKLGKDEAIIINEAEVIVVDGVVFKFRGKQIVDVEYGMRIKM